MPDDFTHDTPEAAPSGYAFLTPVNPRTLMVTHAQSVVVPAPLAISINEARAQLRSLAPDEIDEGLQAAAVALSDAQLRTAKGEAEGRSGPVVASSRDSPAMPQTVRTVERPIRRSGVPGQRVRVVDVAQIQARLNHPNLLERRTPNERKDEEKGLRALVERGPLRTVALRRDWTARLADLEADFPHFAPAIELVAIACAAASTNRKPVRVPPMLLAGDPGLGKSLFVRRLAEVFGAPFQTISFETAETTSALLGSDRHWSNAETGMLFRSIVGGEIANPVVLLDEVDKAPSRAQYQPVNALLGLLEPASAQRATDKCAGITFDASYTVFIGTCNRLSTIPAPVLSRFRVIHIQRPTPRQAVAVARAIAKAVAQDRGADWQVARGEVIQQLAMLQSPRRMYQVLSDAATRAAMAGRRLVWVEDLCDRGDEAPNPASQLH